MNSFAQKFGNAVSELMIVNSHIFLYKQSFHNFYIFLLEKKYSCALGIFQYCIAFWCVNKREKYLREIEMQNTQSGSQYGMACVTVVLIDSQNTVTQHAAFPGLTVLL